MQKNPFAPPSATVGDAIDAERRRPIPVFLVQAIGALLAIVTAFLTVGWAVVLLPFREGWPVPLGYATVTCAVAAILVAMIVGAQRGRRWARWLGLLFVAMVFGLFAVAAIDASLHIVAVTGADVIAVAAYVLVVLAPLAFWFWSLGFSRRARAWFGVQP